MGMDDLPIFFKLLCRACRRFRIDSVKLLPHRCQCGANSWESKQLAFWEAPLGNQKEALRTFDDVTDRDCE